MSNTGRPLAVCVLTTTFPLDNERAIGMHILEKCRALVQKGVRVTVIAPHHPGAARRETLEPGITVRRFRYFIPARWQRLCYGAGMPVNLQHSLLARLQVPLFLAAYLLAVLRTARGHDLFHCHWSPSGLIGILVGRLLRKPVVIMMHHTEPPGRIVRYILKRARHVIYNSTFTRNHFQSRLPLSEGTVISPGVDLERFRPGLETGIRTEYKIPPGACLLFAMGRMIELKGFRFLLEALAPAGRDPELHLILGGDGPLRGDLEACARDKALAGRVHFAGFIPPEQTPRYYRSADIVIMPSVTDEAGETEGLGLVLIEAGACGRPVIGSDTGGIPDVIRDGINGFLVPPGDAGALADKVRLLAADKALRNRLGRAGRQQAEERFNWPAAADRIITVYRSVLEAQQ